MMLALTVAKVLPLHRARQVEAYRCSTHGRTVLTDEMMLGTLTSTSELPLHRPAEVMLTRGILLEDSQMACCLSVDPHRKGFLPDAMSQEATVWS